MTLASALSSDGCITSSHGPVCAQFLEMIPDLVSLSLDFPTCPGNLGFLKNGFTHKDQEKKASSLVSPFSSVSSSPVKFLCRPIYLLPFFSGDTVEEVCKCVALRPSLDSVLESFNCPRLFPPVLCLFSPGFEVVSSLQIK